MGGKVCAGPFSEEAFDAKLTSKAVHLKLITIKVRCPFLQATIQSPHTGKPE
jgi:hypothetical protein